METEGPNVIVYFREVVNVLTSEKCSVHDAKVVRSYLWLVEKASKP